MSDMIEPSFGVARRIKYDPLLPALDAQQPRKKALVLVRFYEVNDQVFMPVMPFHRELNRNEAHSCMALFQHAVASFLTRPPRIKRFADASTKGRMSDTRMLFSNFALHSHWM